MRVDSFKVEGYNEREAQLMAMKYLSEYYDFVFKEVK